MLETSQNAKLEPGKADFGLGCSSKLLNRKFKFCRVLETRQNAELEPGEADFGLFQADY